MDKTEALRLATLWTQATWKRLELMYPGMLGACPVVQINNRLKTTAGRCWWEMRIIEYSYELFAEHTENFRMDVIPHELAHQANWDLFKPAGNGCHDKGWIMIMIRLGLQPDRCHDMINTLHSARRAKVKTS